LELLVFKAYPGYDVHYLFLGSPTEDEGKSNMTSIVNEKDVVNVLSDREQPSNLNIESHWIKTYLDKFQD
jgi:hypothetical protein